MKSRRIALVVLIGIAFAAAVAIAANQGGPYPETRRVVAAHYPVAPPVDLNPCAAGACF
jgi:hypothetical protein